MAVAYVLVVILVTLGIIKLSKRPANFPPGPRGLPVIGFAPFFFKKKPVYKALQDLAKKYGPVTGFFVGPHKAFVAVVGPAAIKEALHNDDLNGRPSGNVILSRTFGEKLGVIFADDELWQEQRRFTLRHLRDLGFGKTSIEHMMMDEVHELIDEIKQASASEPNNVFKFDGTFTLSVINILWAIVAGERYTRDDVRLQALFEHIAIFFRNGNPVTANIPVPQFLLNAFPSIKKFLGINSDQFIPLQSFLQDTINQHKATRSNEDQPRDFLDVYLREMESEEANNPDTTFTYKQLIALVQDLFLAGSDTTSNSIGFAILYMIHYPEIQRKLQTELDSVCGSSLATLGDRSNLPYVDAFLMEIQRKCSIAPVGAPHCARRDTTLMGYTIPQGSVVSINIHSILNDEATWGDPDKFRPERFLDSKGKLIKHDCYVPFGMGKRTCLGEALARNSFYLFVTALAKTFEFKAVPDEPLPSLTPVHGFTLSPRPFNAVVSVRQSTEGQELM